MKQTEENKRGHRLAADLGFKAVGSNAGGWRDAKVRCHCGYTVSWYMKYLQQKHREGCPMEKAPSTTAAPAKDSTMEALALYWGAAHTEDHDDEDDEKVGA
jgi:hypothetical protein